MDAGHGQFVGQGAVAVNLDAVVVTGDLDVVDVRDFRKGGGDLAESGAQSDGLPVLLEGGRTFYGGGLGFDVGEDRGDVRDLAADLGFEARDDVMSLPEWQGLVEL